MDISLHADRQHRAVWSVHTRNYQHLKTDYIWSSLSVKCLEKIVGCYPQSDASDGTAKPASPRHSWFCIRQPSAGRSELLLSGKPRSATDDAAEATDDFLHFFFLTKNTV